MTKKSFVFCQKFRILTKKNFESTVPQIIFARYKPQKFFKPKMFSNFGDLPDHFDIFQALHRFLLGAF